MTKMHRQRHHTIDRKMTSLQKIDDGLRVG